MDTATTILDKLGGNNYEVFTVTLINLLKIPLFVFLLGNIFFSILLLLRVRILVDTFKASENRMIQTLVIIYISFTVILTLLSVLFLILS